MDLSLWKGHWLFTRLPIMKYYETIKGSKYYIYKIDYYETLKGKAELLQLKPHPFICMRNFIDKKVGNQKN